MEFNETQLSVIGGELMEKSLDAPIVPGVGGAGIKLGDTEETVLNTLGRPVERIVMSTGVVKLIFDGITIWLSSDQRVMQIGLGIGYRGQTSDGIYIGMSRDELKKLWGYDLAYHEDDEYWEFISRPGTLFKFTPDEKGSTRVTKVFLAR